MENIIKLLPAIYSLLANQGPWVSILNDVLTIIDKVMTMLGYKQAKPLDVRWLQTRLKELGHDPGPIDGEYGALTKAAVAAFQTAHGDLTVDGWAGPATMAALVS